MLWLLPEKPPLLKVRQIVCFADKQGKAPQVSQVSGERERKVENALNSSYFRLLFPHKRKERKKGKNRSTFEFPCPSINNQRLTGFFSGGNYEVFSLTGIALLGGGNGTFFIIRNFVDLLHPPTYIFFIYACCVEPYADAFGKPCDCEDTTIGT